MSGTRSLQPMPISQLFDSACPLPWTWLADGHDNASLVSFVFDGCWRILGGSLSWGIVGLGLSCILLGISLIASEPSRGNLGRARRRGGGGAMCPASWGPALLGALGRSQARMWDLIGQRLGRNWAFSGRAISQPRRAIGIGEVGRQTKLLFLRVLKGARPLGGFLTGLCGHSGQPWAAIRASLCACWASEAILSNFGHLWPSWMSSWAGLSDSLLCHLRSHWALWPLNVGGWVNGRGKGRGRIGEGRPVAH